MSQELPATDPRPSRALRVGLLVMLGLLLVVTTAIRIRLLPAPFERDEGEYAYGGQLLLQGVPPYQQLYTMKWPGTHCAYALFMLLFGQTPAGVHLGLLIVNFASTLCVFLLARRLGGDITGAVAAGIHALLSANFYFLGFAAHATHFVVLPALGAILLIQNLNEHTKPWRVFAAGLLLGLAALMKQSGAVFGFFALLWILWLELVSLPKNPARLLSRVLVLIAGGLLPILGMCAALALAGVFRQFWLWTVQYARAYVSEQTLPEGLSELPKLFRLVFSLAAVPCIMPVLGGVALVFKKSLREFRFFGLGLTFFSILGVCPGWYFRQHYFLLLLPAASLLAGAAARAGYELAARVWNRGLAGILLLVLFSGTFLFTLYQSRETFFQLPPRMIWARTYSLFTESPAVGAYVRSHCPPGAKIVVLGSEPQIYFYSHRRSATGHIYMYPLMETQPYALAMQQEMIREVESAKPDYVLLVSDPYSWMQRTNSPTALLDWFQDYGKKHLKLVAHLERGINTSSPCWLAIYWNLHGANARLVLENYSRSNSAGRKNP